MSLRNLAQMDVSEIRQFFDSFDYVLCDCDGVVWHLNRSIPGTAETILKLKTCGKHVKFVTNNSTLKVENYLEKFSNMGFDVDSDDIIYPTLAIIDHLKSRSFDKSVFLIGATAMQEDLENSGFRLVKFDDFQTSERNTPDYIRAQILESLQDDPSVGAVIIDFDFFINYTKLQKAITLLMNEDVLFLGGATDKNIFLRKDKYFIGPGYFQTLLQDASKRQMEAFGKPSENLARFLRKKFKNDDSSRTLFVGDSLEQDISFAKKCGYQSLLVLSGATNLDQAENQSEKPDFYISDLSELGALIEKIKL